jgi:hypothetical protein
MTTQEKKPIHQAGTADGWHGVIQADGEFSPEAGRYHLYIGKAFFLPFRGHPMIDSLPAIHADPHVIR